MNYKIFTYFASTVLCYGEGIEFEPRRLLFDIEGEEGKLYFNSSSITIDKSIAITYDKIVGDGCNVYLSKEGGDNNGKDIFTYGSKNYKLNDFDVTTTIELSKYKYTIGEVYKLKKEVYKSKTGGKRKKKVPKPTTECYTYPCVEPVDDKIINDKESYYLIVLKKADLFSCDKFIFFKDKHNDTEYQFNLIGKSNKTEGINTDSEEQFKESLLKLYKDVKDSTDSTKIEDVIEDIKNYEIYIHHLLVSDKLTTDKAYDENGKLTKDAIEYIKESFYNGISDTDHIQFYKLNDYKINDIKLSDELSKTKKIKDIDSLKEKIDNLLKGRTERIKISDIQTKLSKQTDVVLNKIKFKNDDLTKVYGPDEEIDLEIIDADENLLTNKKVVLKYEIDASKKDELTLKKDIVNKDIIFSDDLNEKVKILNYINNYVLKSANYKVVKGSDEVEGDDVFEDGGEYTILFTDNDPDYTQVLKPDDISVNIEFNVNDIEKLKINESNKTCVLNLEGDKCKITDLIDSLNNKFNSIKNTGIIVGIKKSGSDAELLNDTSYVCEKNVKYIITLGGVLNDLVQEVVKEEPKTETDNKKVEESITNPVKVEKKKVEEPKTETDNKKVEEPITNPVKVEKKIVEESITNQVKVDKENKIDNTDEENKIETVENKDNKDKKVDVENVENNNNNNSNNALNNNVNNSTITNQGGGSGKPKGKGKGKCNCNCRKEKNKGKTKNQKSK